MSHYLGFWLWEYWTGPIHSLKIVDCKSLLKRFIFLGPFDRNIVLCARSPFLLNTRSVRFACTNTHFFRTFLFSCMCMRCFIDFLKTWKVFKKSLEKPLRKSWKCFCRVFSHSHALKPVLSLFNLICFWLTQFYFFDARLRLFGVINLS